MSESRDPELHEAIWLTRSGRPSDAIPLLSRIIERDPDSSTALWERASARLFCDDIVGALCDCDEMIRRWPDNTRGYTKRADVYERVQDWPRGIDDYASAIAIDPQHEYAWFQRGRLKAFAGDLTGAINDFTESMKHDSMGPLSGLLNRGNARQLAGDLVGALSDLNAAMPLDVSRIHAPYLRGCLRLAATDFAGAISDFDVAPMSFPQLTNALRLRARAKKRKGDFRGAAEDLRKYRRLGGKDLPAYSWHSQGCDTDD